MSAASHKPPPRRFTSVLLLLFTHLSTARAGFTLAAGDDCTVSANGACVESDGYAAGNDYKDSQSCSITLQPSAALEVISFAVEDYFDHMTISGTQYTGTNGPAGVVPTTTIEWSSDDYTGSADAGWKLCVSGGGAVAASPSPPSGSGAAAAAYGFTVESGPCTVTAGGDCVRSDNYPGAYATSKSCVIAPTQDLRLSSTAFATEKNYDMLTIGGETFTGTLGPTFLSVTANQKLEWVSDSSVTDTGCALCCASPRDFHPHMLLLTLRFLRIPTRGSSAPWRTCKKVSSATTRAASPPTMPATTAAPAPHTPSAISAPTAPTAASASSRPPRRRAAGGAARRGATRLDIVLVLDRSGSVKPQWARSKTSLTSSSLSLSSTASTRQGTFDPSIWRSPASASSASRRPPRSTRPSQATAAR